MPMTPRFLCRSTHTRFDPVLIPCVITHFHFTPPGPCLRQARTSTSSRQPHELSMAPRLQGAQGILAGFFAGVLVCWLALREPSSTSTPSPSGPTVAHDATASGGGGMFLVDSDDFTGWKTPFVDAHHVAKTLASHGDKIEKRVLQSPNPESTPYSVPQTRHRRFLPSTLNCAGVCEEGGDATRQPDCEHRAAAWPGAGPQP